MKIYLSGPITGIDNYRENFREAVRGLKVMGYCDIINPAELCEVLPPEHTSYETYLRMSLELLQMAEAMVLLPGWEASTGCNREVGFAIAKGLELLDYHELLEGGHGDS